MPCEAVAGQPRYFLGNPHQHGLAPVLVDKYVNVTLVPNPPGAERWVDNSAAGDCASNFCNPESAPCSQWPPPFMANVFQKQGQVNFAVGHKTGFKAVQARKYWQGVWSYRNLEGCDGQDNVCGNPATSSFRSYQSAPDRTRYLALTINATFEDTVNGIWADGPLAGTTANSTVNGTLDLTYTIDKNSGLPVLSGVSAVPNCSGFTAFPRNNNCSPVNGCLAALGGPGWNPNTSNYSVAFWNWQTVVSHMTTYIFGSNETLTFDLAAGSFHRTIGDGLGNTLFDEQISISADGTSFQYNSTLNVFGDNQTYQGNIEANSSAPVEVKVVSVTGTLSLPYKDSDVYNEVNGTGGMTGLLGMWNLADDEQLPWRTDTFVGVAPLVTRDEAQTNSMSAGFYAQDFGNPVANSNNSYDPDTANMPLPTWLGRCGIVPNPDPRSGTAITVIPFSNVAQGTVIPPSQIPNPFNGGAIASYDVSGTWPPGVNFDAGTGTYGGTVDLSGVIDPATGEPVSSANYGVTITMTGPASVTGNIIGAPNPAGYTDYYQFGWLDYRGCCCPDDSPACDPSNPPAWSWYQLGWGKTITQFNLDTGSPCIPGNATNWTNWWEAANKPQGAWMFYNDQTQTPVPCDSVDPTGSFNAGAFWACKYAEIPDIWPSQNFARPAGADKYAFDESQPVYCATILSPNTISLVDFNGNPPPDGTLFNGIWGGKSVGGFYSGVTHSVAGIVTLGQKVTSVPSNWQSAAGAQSGGKADDTAVCFGMLRFPNCPSLLGRIAITPDAIGTTMSFGVPPSGGQPTFGMAINGQETVDLWDKNMNQIATGVTATRVDDLHFTIAAPQMSAAYVTITGAPKYYMNDGDPKGDYALLEWLSDFRTGGNPNNTNSNGGEFGRLTGVMDCGGAQVPQPTHNAGGGPVTAPYAFFSQTPGCVPFVPCSPKVICITPNGEQFPGGFTSAFPPMMPPGQLPGASDQFYFDDTYGSKWWRWIEVTMTDLLWEPPHPPCGFVKPNADPPETLQWKEDDGSCQQASDETSTDGSETIIHHRFYQHRPQVEARLSVPCNYGNGQNECAPALPAGIQIGWSSPVQGIGQDIALPPVPPGTGAKGRPGTANTAYHLHALLCLANGAGCYLNYKPVGC